VRGNREKNGSLENAGGGVRALNLRKKKKEIFESTRKKGTEKEKGGGGSWDHIENIMLKTPRKEKRVPSLVVCDHSGDTKNAGGGNC